MISIAVTFFRPFVVVCVCACVRVCVCACVRAYTFAHAFITVYSICLLKNLCISPFWKCCHWFNIVLCVKFNKTSWHKHVSTTTLMHFTHTHARTHARIHTRTHARARTPSVSVNCRAYICMLMRQSLWGRCSGEWLKCPLCTSSG